MPALPSVFAPPGFLIERISLKPVGYGETRRLLFTTVDAFVTVFDTRSQWSLCL